MATNVLIHAATRGPVAHAARLAMAAGHDVGLVATSIELGQEKLSGGRIEEERDYAGATVNALDEPVFIGSAVAQLAGHAEAVIVDGLESWVERVMQRFPSDPIERGAEISSLVSVMEARMADLILIARPLAAGSSACELFALVLAAAEKHADTILDLRDGSPVVRKGSLRS